MAKAISLKILKLQYGGESIGDDIFLEIEIAEEKFSSYQTIKCGSTFEYNQEVKQLRGIENTVEIPLKIKVTEKDFLFSDVGENTGVILIDLNYLPQTFDFQVKVQERNKLTFGKSTAIFLITLEAREFNPIYPRPQVYVSPSKKDYNRFDTEIADAVGQWNDEFLNEEYPPNSPLDPNLVKAMVYVESEFGYYVRRKTIRNPHPYPSYPDVMQVADSANAAMYAFHNIYNPITNKMGTEYEIINGKEILFYHPEANGKTTQQSIYWGVRWLYKKAQINVPKENRREWKNWQDAVHDYNGGGDKKYKDKVLTIFKTGKTIDELKLWSLGVLIAIGLVSVLGLNIGLRNYTNSTLQNFQTATAIQSELFQSYRSGYVSQYNSAIIANNILKTFRNVNKDPLKSAIFRTFTEDDQSEIEDIELFPYDSSLFVAIIAYEKDWWEEFKIGEFQNGKIKWLEIKNWPKDDYIENSILSARWMHLKGISTPVLEVFGITHMGNGEMYLFKVEKNQYSLLFKETAVRGFWPTGETSEGNLKKYGYENCEETFKDGKLSAEYPDLNDDGVSDVVLIGSEEIVCDKITGENKDGTINTTSVTVSESPVKYEYFLNIR
jgi:hypothetical protein